MLRTIVEKLARGRTLKRRLPERFSRRPIFVSPDAQLKYMKPGAGAFDAELLSIVDEYVRNDTVAWDVGANVGVFAFAAASKASKGFTLAIEADIWLAQLMRKSLMLPENAALNMQILPAAVADRSGAATFLIAGRGRASNALEVAHGSRTQFGAVRERVTVPILTLDILLDFFEPPTLLKVDVEGAEALVLRGAGRLLREVRPITYVEVGGAASEEVASILSLNDYVLFDGSKPLDQQEPVAWCAFNTLALPRKLYGERRA